jgi:hypothetical protein
MSRPQAICQGKWRYSALKTVGKREQATFPARHIPKFLRDLTLHSAANALIEAKYGM